MAATASVGRVLRTYFFELSRQQDFRGLIRPVFGAKATHRRLDSVLRVVL